MVLRRLLALAIRTSNWSNDPQVVCRRTIRIAVVCFSSRACQMVFYGGRPQLGSLGEQELGREGRVGGGRGVRWWRLREMKFVSLRQQSAVCVDLLCWRKSRPTRNLDQRASGFYVQHLMHVFISTSNKRNNRP